MNLVKLKRTHGSGSFESDGEDQNTVDASSSEKGAYLIPVPAGLWEFLLRPVASVDSSSSSSVASSVSPSWSGDPDAVLPMLRVLAGRSYGEIVNNSNDNEQRAATTCNISCAIRRSSLRAAICWSLVSFLRGRFG